nr:hypothetical protein Iba_chr04fCG3300 [Ipomoea batatas]
MSSLTEDSGPIVTTRPVFPSSKTTWMAEPCSPSTFPPVKRGSDNFDLKCSCKFLPSGPSILFGETLFISLAGANFAKARSTSSLTCLRRIGSSDEQSFCRLSTFSASTITLH